MIELIVVIGVSVLISGIAILYSRTGQNQIALSVEAAKISQFILQAKQLSVATYSGDVSACGYGVSFDYLSQTYSLFAYTPAGAPPCPRASAVSGVSPTDMSQYTVSTWRVPVAKGVTLVTAVPANDAMSVVMFYPPNPATFISRETSTVETFMIPTQDSKVYLRTIDGSDMAAVSVGSAGQVQF